MFDPIGTSPHVRLRQDPLAYGYSLARWHFWFMGYPEQALLAAPPGARTRGAFEIIPTRSWES